MLKLDEIRPAASALITQAGLLIQLARLEWAAEKLRLVRLLAFSLLAVAMTVVLLLSISILALALAWDTPYRWLVALALVVIYAAGLFLVVRRLLRLSSPTAHPFAATRAELTADLALIKRRLLL